MIYILIIAASFTFPNLQLDSQVEWISPMTHDFGDIPFGKIATVDFEFENKSERPLTIDNVRVTCGCTATDWEEDVIQPNTKSKIHIEFEAKKEGYFRKKITVFFSDDKKAHKLFVEGYVE